MTKRDYLSEFEQLVLLATIRLGENANGATIRMDLEQTADRPVAVATIYVALTRMEKRGFVRSWLSDPTPVRGGKAKKFYAVLPPGIEALRESRAVLQRMWEGTASVLGPEAP